MQRSRSIEADLLKLKDIQLRIKDLPGWYRRARLQEKAAGAMPWKAFDACLTEIREGKAPEWGYVVRGRESAYFLHKLAKALPETLRPSEEEEARFMRSELRQHVLRTIDLALESYRLVEQHGAENYELYRRLLVDAVDPFVLHLVSLVRRGELPLPPNLVPREEFKRAGAMAKVKWLLDLQAWMA